MPVMRNTALQAAGAHDGAHDGRPLTARLVRAKKRIDPAMVRQIGRILQQKQHAATPSTTGPHSRRATMVTRVPTCLPPRSRTGAIR